MKRYKTFTISGMALSLMLFATGCGTQGTGSLSTSATNHSSSTNTNKTAVQKSINDTSTTASSNQTSPQPSKADSIDMVSQNIGWDFHRVGGNNHPTVLRTTNGGQTWTNVTPPQLTRMQSTLAGGTSIDATHAWFVSSPSTVSADATVFRTSNGGQTWSSVKLPRHYVMTWMSFINSQSGWILASRVPGAGTDPSDLFYTNNGGKSWVKINDSKKAPLLISGKTGITFENAKTGWMTAENEFRYGKFHLYVTHDGGHKWTPQAVTVPIHINHLAHPLPPVFSSTTHGVIPVYFDGGSQSILFFTNNGGRSWVASKPVPLKKISQIAVSGPTTAWVSDGTSLYVTTNAGQTWSKLTGGMSGTSHIIGIHPVSDGASALVFTLANGKVTTHKINTHN